ncbi:ATP-grasp domain-containing protein [Streptomyces sp. NBC_01549]|uniref:ATP-grasp domain-containing protein n=1 Tax=Streptomyces sp. NBC_01549 TaxID=2975874 RepID=UPI002253AA70|nr:ATP-grasp domain-containing protein [Streptomyces sp. NBC_01549]MCX4593660.1 ATP-grasp domain-containing protein [Streptomyces sp. NBC_01549]
MSTTVSPRVLMIGWNTPAFLALKEHHADVVSVIAPRHVRRAKSHAPDATHVVVPNDGDVEQILAGLARAEIAIDEFDFVCTIGEWPIVAAALLAEHGKAVGMKLSAAIALRDKFVQKRLVREAGLPVAGAQMPDLLSDLDGEQLTYPIVIKPLTGAGSQDTHVVSDAAELASLVETYQQPPRGPWLVEEFMEGEELHLDGVVRAGVVRALSVSRYFQNVIDIKSGGLVGSVLLDPNENPDLYSKAQSLLTGVLDALGHEDGIFHAEAFEKDGELTFSEVGGRLGGGVVQDIVLRRFGVDLSDEWARAALGLPPGEPAEPSKEQCGWVHLQAPAGVAEHVPDESELLAQPGCVEAAISIGPGSQIPSFSAASNMKAGAVIIVGDSEEQVRERTLAAAAWFSQAVTVQAPETV